MIKEQLKIPITIWLKLNKAVRKHGANKRESGAFLLGKINSSKVSHFILYHELDPYSSDNGYIHFRSECYIKLWEICRTQHLTVIADVHTHPGQNTNQSEYHRMHPMIFRKKHIAMIIPHFARRIISTLSGVGVFEYLGDFQWKKYSSNSQRVKLAVL